MKGGRRRSRAASRGRSARRSRSASRGRSARRSRSASRGRSARRSRSASRGRSARRSRSASRGRRGGMGAAEWQIEKGAGPGPVQDYNVWVKNINNPSNASTPVSGIEPTSPASIANAKLNLSGGRKRKGRGKKGGFLGQLINQALVPFGLLGMQHAYGKRSRKH